MDTKTFNNALSLKLKELHEIFNEQADILKNKEIEHENAMTAMHNQLTEKEEALNTSQAINLISKLQLSFESERIATLNEKLFTSKAELSSLNEIFDETSRHASETSNRLSQAERRIENMQIELVSYLTRLTEMKKKLRDAEAETMGYREKCCRVNKSLKKSSEDLDDLIVKFEARSKLQDEFIKILMETLKLHGIYDFENDEIIHEILPIVDQDQDSDETSSDVDDFDSKPPLKNYPNWRPSSMLTTILEVDETEEDCGDEKEEEEIERIDSAIESFFQAQSSTIDDDLVNIETLPISPSLINIPAKQEEVTIQILCCDIVDSNQSTDDVTTGSSVPAVQPGDSVYPSSNLATILEVDETEEDCDDEEEEKEEIERIDSAIESDFQTQTSAIDDIETPFMSSSLISIPAKQEEVIIQIENCEIVDPGSSTDDVTTGSSVSMIHSGDSVPEVDAGEDGKKAWKKTKKRQKKGKKKASQSVEAVKVEAKPKLKRRY